MKNYTKIILAIFFLFTLNNSNLFGQTSLEWAMHIGGGSNEGGESVAVDAVGNVYTVGYFTGTVDFDPSLGVYNLTSNGLEDIYIQKVDADGNFVWAKKVGGSSSDWGTSVIIDAMGYAYITGNFRATADFGLGAGTYNLTAMGLADVFVEKIAPNGNMVWVAQSGGVGAEPAGTHLMVDDWGSVYIAGWFDGTVDFNPSSGVYNLTAVGSRDVFLQKLDANGNFIWTKSFGGTSADYAYAIGSDAVGNVYLTGSFRGTVDFNPGASVFNLTSAGLDDIFVQKLDGNGNFVWAKKIGGTSSDVGYSISVTPSGNSYITGWFAGTVDFDPNAGVQNITAIGAKDMFIEKLDANGNLVWVKRLGGTSNEESHYVCTDAAESVYLTGNFAGTVDFDPNAGTQLLTSNGGQDVYIEKLDSNGNFVWVRSLGGPSDDLGNCITKDVLGNIYVAGSFQQTLDFDIGAGVLNGSSNGIYDLFVVKLGNKKIMGHVYNDYNQNCIKDNNELGLSGRTLLINPGNIVTTSNLDGIWKLDMLPIGNYTATISSLGPWQATCPLTQNFTVVHPDSLVAAPSFGFVSNSPCSEPDISICTPFLRPGFGNPIIYVNACNLQTGTGALTNSYVIVELDPLFVVQSGSLPYTSLGNNQYLVNTGTIFPGQCVNFWFESQLDSAVVIGQTLCMNATIYPIDSCSLDTIPNPSTGVTPCTGPWDRSSLSVEVSCVGDSVRFVIYNNGSPINGNMDCFTPVRVYLNGVLTILDSIQLQGGDSIVFMFPGNNQTWHLEADQHPLHPGNSHPNATIENCGTGGVWTRNLVNIFDQDDADPMIDIYCGLVIASFDPNDKTGYPLGIGTSNDILPNQDIEYVIRFQNTGNDTAFTVVIRDTLSTDFDIFSVRSGVSSDDYTFRMYGTRILEWTFSNILLPDSTINEPASHGFVTFKVKQSPDLANGTVLENSAAIYFDFNAPIITNTSWHTINDAILLLSTEIHLLEEQIQIKVYPNPTTGILHIDKLDNGQITILVLDNLGRTLLTQESNDVITDINMSNLPAGVYYISINNGKQLATQKVVKQ